MLQIPIMLTKISHASPGPPAGLAARLVPARPPHQREAGLWPERSKSNALGLKSEREMEKRGFLNVLLPDACEMLWEPTRNKLFDSVLLPHQFFHSLHSCI